MVPILRSGWLRMLFVAALAAAMPVTSGQLSAQDASLYDDPPPDDAAYLRFFGFPEATTIDAFGLSFSADRLNSGRYNILHGDAVEGVTRGQIMTVVPDTEGAVVILQEPPRSRRKVMLQLVNLTEGGPISLKTVDGSVEIISPSDMRNIGSREVNPIQVSVAVFGQNGAIGEPVDLTLRINQHLTFVVSKDGTLRVFEDDAIPEPMK